MELKAAPGLAAVALSDDTLLWMTVSGNGSYSRDKAVLC